nr:hypothetical protein [Maioricimonas rarisocia]
MMDGPWKLVANRDVSHIELYDLRSDPLETTDVSDKQPAAVNELLAKLEAWQETLPKEPTGNVFSSEREE